jgi:hypothetical protein
MFIDVNFDTAKRIFLAYDRGDNFTDAGLRLILEHFESMEEETGERIEFDCIAICCEFTEYETLAVALAAFGKTSEDFHTAEAAADWLADRGTLLYGGDWKNLDFDSGPVVFSN